MNITVFGANGRTGRQLVRQALAAGHDVVAVTRRPAEFPISHDQLTIAKADVRDELAVKRVLEIGSDAVLSTLGVPFDKKPIDIYSDGITKITQAMTRQGIKRIVAVSSTAVEPHPHAEGGFLLNRIMQPLVSKTIGKTTYADMRAMEAILRHSNLAWTVVRSAGLSTPTASRRTTRSATDHSTESSPAAPTSPHSCWRRPPTSATRARPSRSPRPRVPQHCCR